MSEQTTHIPQIRRLQRSRSDRMIAGVSGGLARYFEIHPAVFRVGFVVLTLLGGAGLLIYAAAALVIPDEGKEDSVATAALRNRRDRPWPLIGLGLLAVAGAILLSRATLWPDGDVWWLFLIAGGVILWLTRHPSSAAPTDGVEPAAMDAEATPRPRRRRVRRVFGWLAIVVASLVALLVIAVAIFAAVFDVHPGRGIGEQSYVVTRPEALRDEYRLGIGSLELDLSEMRVPARRDHVETRVDVGDLRIILPPGVALRGYAEAQRGTRRPARTGRRRVERRRRPRRAPATASSTSRPTSARGRCASSAPYDDARMSLRTFAPSPDERVIAGVCAGIAQTLGVDATLVRLVFALLALAGGAGILLYLALWAWAEGTARLARRRARVRRGRRAARRARALEPVGRRHRADRRRARARVAPGRQLPPRRAAVVRRHRAGRARGGRPPLGRRHVVDAARRPARSRAHCS